MRLSASTDQQARHHPDERSASRAGKTTFSGKLANMLKAEKTTASLLVGCDVYRPAAIEQLRVVKG